MATNIRNCEIRITIEEEDQTLFTGSIGKGLHWTKLECAFIIQAMATVMEGSTNELVVNMGIARCVGVVKRAGVAADEVGLSRKTFTKMMSQETAYKTRRGKKDD